MRTRVMCGVFLSTFSILGIIGNVLSIIVFTRPSMRTDSNLILSGKTFIFIMAIRFVEFRSGGYKIRNILA